MSHVDLIGRRPLQPENKNGPLVTAGRSRFQCRWEISGESVSVSDCVRVTPYQLPGRNERFKIADLLRL